MKSKALEPDIIMMDISLSGEVLLYSLTESAGIPSVLAKKGIINRSDGEIPLTSLFLGKNGFCESFDKSFFLFLILFIFISDTNKAGGNTADGF